MRLRPALLPLILSAIEHNPNNLGVSLQVNDGLVNNLDWGIAMLELFYYVQDRHESLVSLTQKILVNKVIEALPATQ